MIHLFHSSLTLFIKALLGDLMEVQESPAVDLGANINQSNEE
jgi:hypothetical protein